MALAMLTTPFRLFTMMYNSKFAIPSLPPASAFAGQTILITGGTGGIGLASAIHFINLGASLVIITARTAEKGLAAKNAIEERTGTQGEQRVRAMVLDMCTFENIKLFTEDVKREVENIDYLLLNAGLINRTFKAGGEGYEECIQTHVLGTALMAILLLPWVKTAGRGKGHLGFVTSGLHRSVDISSAAGFPQDNVLEFFNQKENWPSKGMYGTSKLLEQYVANEIAQLAVGKDGKPEVIVNPMCPGMVKSDLGRQYKSNPLVGVAVDIFMNTVPKSTEAGARTYVLAALTTPEENGKYITHYQSDEDYRKVAEKNVYGAEGRKMQQQVWKEVLVVLEEKVPEVREIMSRVQA